MEERKDWEEVLQKFTSPEIIHNYYKGDDFQHVILMLDSGVGIIRVYQYFDDQELVTLDMLNVEERYRNKGIGKKLMEWGEKIGKNLGVKYIYLQVEKGSWMEKWYSRLGYKFDKLNEEDPKWIWMKKGIKP